MDDQKRHPHENSDMLDNHEFGIQKKFWNEELYQAGAILGYYAPTSINDPEAKQRLRTEHSQQSCR